MSGARNENPAHGGNREANIERNGDPAYVASLSELYGSPKLGRIPNNWRERLPDAGAYYREHVPKLGIANATGWAQGQCPFHKDRNKSLSVCIASERGGWRCFAGCGGGDLVGFHGRLRGLDFRTAVCDLLGVRG